VGALALTPAPLPPPPSSLQVITMALQGNLLAAGKLVGRTLIGLWVRSPSHLLHSPPLPHPNPNPYPNPNPHLT